MKKSNLTNLVAGNFPLKLLSLLLAVVLWFFVGGENRINKNVMIPIEIINLPRDLVISNQFKKEIEVTVNGPRSVILEMSKKAVTRQVDLSKATPGTMVIENDKDHIPVPRGVTVQRVQPASIILSLDKLISKNFPVSARTVGEVAKNYYVKEVRTDPDVITITGPQTILMQLDELYTKPINLDNVRKSAQIQVPLELPPPIVDLIGETSVTADFKVALETVTKTISGLKIELGDINLKPDPPVVDITANIPKLLMSSKKQDLRDLFLVTAIPREGEDKYEVRVIPRPELEVPIKILSILPPRVVVNRSGGSSMGRQGAEKISSATEWGKSVVALPLPDVMQTKSSAASAVGNPRGPKIITRIDREKEKRKVQ